MTYREKLQMELPENIDKGCYGGCRGCPHSYGYCHKSKTYCKGLEVTDPSPEKCTKCWNQTIPKIKKLPPDEKKTTWKATYAVFKDGHREEIFYCSGMNNSLPIDFVTESGMYVYYEKPTTEIYELHHPTKPRLTFKEPRQCFHKITTYLNYGELNVMTCVCREIDHIEFEEVEIDE